jgi:hypothetical protein
MLAARPGSSSSGCRCATTLRSVASTQRSLLTWTARASSARPHATLRTRETALPRAMLRPRETERHLQTARCSRTPARWRRSSNKTQEVACRLRATVRPLAVAHVPARRRRRRRARRRPLPPPHPPHLRPLLPPPPSKLRPSRRHEPAAGAYGAAAAAFSRDGAACDGSVCRPPRRPPRLPRPHLLPARRRRHPRWVHRPILGRERRREARRRHRLLSRRPCGASAPP